MKKKVLSLILIILTLLVVTTPALAYSTTVTRTSSGRTFSSDWEAYTSGGDWVMIYGFNTAWIDEDYTHGNHNTKWHIVRVKNANGTFSNYDNAGDWARKEVTHSGSYIRYIMEW